MFHVEPIAQKRLGVCAFGKFDDHQMQWPPVALDAGRLNAPNDVAPVMSCREVALNSGGDGLVQSSETTRFFSAKEPFGEGLPPRPGDQKLCQLWGVG